MLIALSRRTAICQSDAKVSLTGVVPLGAVNHRFNNNKVIITIIIIWPGHGAGITTLPVNWMILGLFRNYCRKQNLNPGL